MLPPNTAAVPSPDGLSFRTQYVLEGIKHRILTGQLTPGQALVETEFAVSMDAGCGFGHNVSAGGIYQKVSSKKQQI